MEKVEEPLKTSEEDSFTKLRKDRAEVIKQLFGLFQFATGLLEKVKASPQAVFYAQIDQEQLVYTLESIGTALDYLRGTYNDARKIPANL